MGFKISTLTGTQNFVINITKVMVFIWRFRTLVKPFNRKNQTLFIIN